MRSVMVRYRVKPDRVVENEELVRAVPGNPGLLLNLALAEHMAILSYTDRPGIVGVVGQILGEEGINIGGMQVSRDVRGGHALIALTVDTAIPPALLDVITEEIGAVFGRAIDFTQS